MKLKRKERNKLKKKIVLILPLLAGILFGAAGVFVRKLYDFGMENATVLFSRAVFALFAIFLFIFFYDRSLLKIRIQDIALFAGTGLLGMLGLNLCYNEALQRLTLSLAAVLLSTAPVFVILLAAVLFKEKITFKKLFCIALAILGCVLVSGLFEQPAGFRLSSAGFFLGIASAFFCALYNIFSRIATDKSYHTYTVIFYSVFLMTLVLLPAVDFGKIRAFLTASPGENILFLTANALCTLVLPYIFLTLTLRYAESGKVAILSSGGEPAAAAVFGLIFYSEKLSVWMLLGLAVTVAALALLCITPQNAAEKKVE